MHRGRMQQRRPRERRGRGFTGNGGGSAGTGCDETTDRAVRGTTQVTKGGGGSARGAVSYSRDAVRTGRARAAGKTRSLLFCRFYLADRQSPHYGVTFGYEGVYR